MFGGDLDIYSSNLTGNLSAVDMDKGNGNNFVDIYNSEISRTSTDTNYGAIYLNGTGAYDNNANIYNSTLEDYRVEGSQLNVYWYLTVSNPLSADATVINASNSTVSTFSDSRTIALREYYVIPTDQRFNSTPHWISATKTDYVPLSPTSINMNQNREYTISMVLIPFAGMIANTQSALLVLSIVIAFLAVLFIAVRLQEKVTIRDLITIVITVIFLIIAISFALFISSTL